jgi:hypothetical protein
MGVRLSNSSIPKIHFTLKPSGALNPTGMIIKPDSAAHQRGIISNGVNIISYRTLSSTHRLPARGFEIFDYKIQSSVTFIL